LPVDEDLRLALRRWSPPVDREGLVERVAHRKARLRWLRRFRIAALVLVVLGGTTAGSLLLVRSFRTTGIRLGSPRVTNGKIAYVTIGKHSAIWVVNPDGSGRTMLTAAHRISGPAWSPHGAKIAFASPPETAVDGPPASHIYVMNPDGTGRVDLSTGGGLDLTPAWSPDGTRIAFSSNRSDPTTRACYFCDLDLYVMNADGTGVHRLTYGEGRDISPTWSPDGKRIAFVRVSGLYRNEHGTTMVMNADGSDIKHLCRWNPGCPDGEVAHWSPDGRTLAFMDNGSTQIWLSDADGRNPRAARLPCFTDLEPGAFPNRPTEPGTCLWFAGGDWAPDGTGLVVAVAGLPNQSGRGIYLVKPDGSEVHQIAVGGVMPSWQPLFGVGSK